MGRIRPPHASRHCSSEYPEVTDRPAMANEKAADRGWYNDGKTKKTKMSERRR